MHRDISIMILRKVGKVRHFKTSSLFLLVTSLFFACFVVFSVIVINGYFAKQRENTVLRKEIALLEHQESRADQTLFRMRQRVALLQDYIRLLEESSDKPSQETSSKPLVPTVMAIRAKDTPIARKKALKAAKKLKPRPASEQKTAHMPRKPKKAHETDNAIVALQRLTASRKNTRLTVSFRLVNTAKTMSRLKGYLHMTILDKNVEPPRIRSFPHEVLKKGIPVNYKRGQLFVIKRFKLVHGRFFLGGTRQSPSSLRVFVYDKNGLLLLDRELDLKDTV